MTTERSERPAERPASRNSVESKPRSDRESNDSSRTSLNTENRSENKPVASDKPGSDVKTNIDNAKANIDSKVSEVRNKVEGIRETLESKTREMREEISSLRDKIREMRQEISTLRSQSRLADTDRSTSRSDSVRRPDSPASKNDVSAKTQIEAKNAPEKPNTSAPNRPEPVSSKTEVNSNNGQVKSLNRVQSNTDKPSSNSKPAGEQVNVKSAPEKPNIPAPNRPEPVSISKSTVDKPGNQQSVANSSSQASTANVGTGNVDMMAMIQQLMMILAGMGMSPNIALSSLLGAGSPVASTTASPLAGNVNTLSNPLPIPLAGGASNPLLQMPRIDNLATGLGFGGIPVSNPGGLTNLGLSALQAANRLNPAALEAAGSIPNAPSNIFQGVFEQSRQGDGIGAILQSLQNNMQSATLGLSRLNSVVKL